MALGLALALPYQRNPLAIAVDFTPITATGGTVTDVTIAGRLWRVHDFTTSGDLTVTDLGTNPEDARALLVAGGGSGGYHTIAAQAPGSGAGGEVKAWSPTVTIGTFSFVIGAGGAPVTTNVNGLQGSDSTAFGVNCDGGGYGGYTSSAGGAAVDGGGGGVGTGATGALGGAGTRKGGDGFGSTGATRASGGGAGAGTAGGNASSGHGGAGGDGVASNITGTSTYYGAGAGGGAEGTNVVGPAGLGGVAGVLPGAAANNGTDGLGNGGTSGMAGGSSGKGGKGRGVFSYPLEAA